MPWSVNIPLYEKVNLKLLLLFLWCYEWYNKVFPGNMTFPCNVRLSNFDLSILVFLLFSLVLEILGFWHMQISSVWRHLRTWLKENYKMRDIFANKIIKVESVQILLFSNILMRKLQFTVKIILFSLMKITNFTTVSS